ncbi:alpha/beta hydrolase family protein [Noviherbaspirillum pedocola]|uniref:Alpha/beta fold hydrolase n=1 Tax=Noviherbaspirillum pedocola TaxID=2801341 RepID=A0A934SQ57_9BURK|nr:alpha/beta fold hydrolase [Noviherbaspirillum pedocola]MBK4733071.1 alpha/beta fold hydrolase [Noviherbaspirillum pedocola]
MMNGIPASPRQVHAYGTLPTDSNRDETPATDLALQAAQLAQMQEAARSSLPPEIPLQPMQQPQPAPTSATVPASMAMQASAIPVHTETVELENHVSMQIFSSPMTQNSNKVVMFLHGGPGLAYDQGFQPVTDWFVGHGCTLVAPEIAGSGKPGLSETSNSHTQNYVRDLKAIVRCLRERPDMQGKDVCVVAHSWGGFQLASFLTDESLSEEERQFFKQAVFIAANLDSAQTRLFADASHFNDQSATSLLGFEQKLVTEFERRHAGFKDEVAEADRMTVTNNPLIDQSLNERFSPFYRLDKLPREMSCLFIHATDDKQVPVSQSVEAFAKINDAGGDARIIIPQQGGHGFFKAGDGHRADTMRNCFGAIDAFIQRPDTVKGAIVGDVGVPEAKVSNIEKKIRDSEKTYRNTSKLLDDFHRGVDFPAPEDGQRIPNKKTLLKKFAEAHEVMVTKYAGNNAAPAVKTRKLNEDALDLINKALGAH